MSDHFPRLAQAAGELNPDLTQMSFPSDSLSIERFRAIFPDQFDLDGCVSGSYPCLFFYPQAPGEPGHLSRLSDLLGFERTMAAGGYFTHLEPHFGVILDEEDHQTLKKSS